ncbi:MAG: hypothetical protein FD167_5211, partial [bacterium]
MNKRILTIVMNLFLVTVTIDGLNAQVLPLREQAKLIDEVIDDRL